MFRRELRVNFKNFIIWTMILIGIFLVVFLVYPSLTSNENIKMIDEMMTMFPEEMLKAFNMDITSIDTVFGWMKTEGFTFVLLITGIYSGILGANILLNSLPVTRRSIVFSRILCGAFYIVLMIFVVGIFNFVGLSLSGDFDKKAYLLLSVTPIFSSLTIFAVCLFLSTFTHKTKKTLGISLGIVFASYFLNIVSELGESTEFLRYVSIFTLADVRNVIIDIAINPVMILMTVVLVVAFMILALVRYERKELV